MEKEILEAVTLLQKQILILQESSASYWFNITAGVASIFGTIFTLINFWLLLNFTTRAKRKRAIKYLTSELKKYYEKLDDANQGRGQLPSDIMNKVKDVLHQIRKNKFIWWKSSLNKEINSVINMNYDSTENLNKVVLSLNSILNEFEEVL